MYMEAVYIIIGTAIAIGAILIFMALSKKEQYRQPKELSDFFKTDICDIMRYSPTLVDDSVNEVGTHVRRYTMRLQDYELGTFYDATIHQFDDGKYNLMLEGKDGRLTRDVAEFVDFCAARYGIDRDGKREVTKDDYRQAEQGLFSRWWDGLIIDNINPDRRLNLSIFGIVPRVGE